ncbi:hypothetical protein F5Y16DRAFT_402551 [Xylariaceae sp. FL0255]|nr:hypothetical protein F5Y16DRAFT_402551 [Xylariaceae sp. FL0255]
MTVQKGNTIFVPANTLSQEHTVTIHWSQSRKDRSETYYVSKFTNKAGGSEQDLIFVQVSKLHELAEKSQGDEKYTLVIDENWQYGQRKDGSNRFLVYHDKSYEPYQHRFVENFITQAGGAAAEIAKSLGYPVVDKVGDLAKRFIGDYLHTF